MNFIVVMLDTMRPDHVGAYGHGLARTPNLDRFAKDAMRFDKAYCASWPTMPNRNDLMTGRYGNPFHYWKSLDVMDVTLPEAMGRDGYVTQLIHDTPHLINGGMGFDRPFHAWWMIRGNEVDRCWTDHYDYELNFERDRVHDSMLAYEILHQRNIRHRSDAEEDRFCAQVMTAASRWLQDNYKREKLFLWVDCFDPHEPWDPPQHYIDLYDPGYEGNTVTNFFAHPSTTPRELKNIQARYAAKVTLVDAWLGRLLDQIDNLGIRDETVVTILSDHGTGLADHTAIPKAPPFYEEIARTVCMMRVPGVTDGGGATDALVQPPDIMPTLLDLAEIEIEYDRQGHSLVPILKNPDERVRDIALTGNLSHPHHVLRPITVNDPEWTYIHAIKPKKDELYRTVDDPKQQNNLIDQHPDQAQRLRQAMFAQLDRNGIPDWMRKSFEAREVLDPPEPTAEDRRRMQPHLYKKLPVNIRFRGDDEYTEWKP